MSNAHQDLVSALATVTVRLQEISQAVTPASEVRSVSSGVHPRRLADGDRIEFYVDAELTNGSAVGWWLEFRFAEGLWHVESSVRLNTAAGEDELLGLPTRYASNDQELVTELHGAARALVTSVPDIDLAAIITSPSQWSNPCRRGRTGQRRCRSRRSGEALRFVSVADRLPVNARRRWQFGATGGFELRWQVWRDYPVKGSHAESARSDTAGTR